MNKGVSQGIKALVDSSFGVRETWVLITTVPYPLRNLAQVGDV